MSLAVTLRAVSPLCRIFLRLANRRARNRGPRQDRSVQRLDALGAFPTPTAAGRVECAAPVQIEHAANGHMPKGLERSETEDYSDYL